MDTVKEATDDTAFDLVLEYIKGVSSRHHKKKTRLKDVKPPLDKETQQNARDTSKKKKDKMKKRHHHDYEAEVSVHSVTSNKSSRHKRKKEDIYSMASLLANELQPYYDPVSEQKYLQGDIRSRSDHVGRPMKHGPFTKQEHEILKSAIEKYFQANSWNDKEGWNHISTFGTGSGRSTRQKEVLEAQHWEKISMALPKRSVRSVQLYALRRLYPWKTGAWTPQEEKDLIDLVARYGCSWTKFAYEYFQRPPNYIQSKWRDLEPRLSHHQGLHSSKRHVWTKEEDIRLLKAIKLVTGVALPYRAVPWREVQLHMPQFTTTALSWRYKNTLFPSILEGQFKGAKERVLFRQFLRYVKRSLEAGLIRDLSEVEGHRIIPFWYSSNHCRRMGRYMKSRCPPNLLNAPFKEQIDFMYKLERCEKKEKHDLRRLARSYEALQKLNGVMILPAQPGILSKRYTNPQTTGHDEKTDAQKTVSRNLFVTLPITERAELLETVARPLTADQQKVQQVVPVHLQDIPEAFPIYLESKKRARRQKASQNSSQISEESPYPQVKKQEDDTLSPLIRYHSPKRRQTSLKESPET